MLSYFLIVASAAFFYLVGATSTMQHLDFRRCQIGLFRPFARYLIAGVSHSSTSLRRRIWLKFAIITHRRKLSVRKPWTLFSNKGTFLWLTCFPLLQFSFALFGRSPSSFLWIPFGQPRSGFRLFWVSMSSTCIAFQSPRQFCSRCWVLLFVASLLSSGRFLAAQGSQSLRHLLPPHMQQLALFILGAIRRRLVVFSSIPDKFLSFPSI